ncbi:hypothetical protein D623_10029552 [Myotis brandtii]|uniref:Uncharacterized protein n=1 Tax=Myotis brandtii TaxID=109478 RepID=S7MVV8_MYOBR|nr:hypothetical protein D623_10029552 [Myotis brandtii]
MRSTGFKTDPIPQPARVPPPKAREQSDPKELFAILGWPPREVWVCGERVTVDWRNPSDKFVFFSSPDARRASFLAAGGMGSPKELSPGKAQAAALLDPKSGRNAVFLKRKKNKEIAFSHLPPRNRQLAPTCPMAALSSELAEESPRD